MNVQTKVSAQNPAGRPKTRFIDCDIHPTMKDAKTERQYLAKKWHEYHNTYGSYTRIPFASADPYQGLDPYASRRDSYPPEGGPPGSSLSFMRQQHLDPMGVDIGILHPLFPNGPNQRNVDYGAAIASAMNEWQVAEFTSQDSRLRASLIVTQDYIENAVAEIRRHGNNKEFAQLGMMQRALEPLGRRRYWPIYAAAQDYDLTVGIHVGGVSGAPPFGSVGWPSFFIQQHQALHGAMAAVLLSFIMEGVFEEYKKLRVMLSEGAFSWLPMFAWRLDKIWERFRSENENLKRPPSEYIRKHVWVTSQPVDVFKDPNDLRQVIDWIGWDRLCIATDYPHWDSDVPELVFPFPMSKEQKNKLYYVNAEAALRL